MTEVADKKTGSTEASTADSGGANAGKRRMSGAKLRTAVARVVWLLFVLCASALAVAALLIALKAEPKNPFVEVILDIAKAVDLGIFSLENPIKKFTGGNGRTMTALFNYGIGAIVYLILGRIIERLIRP